MPCKQRAREARHNAPSRSIDPGFVSPMGPPQAVGDWTITFSSCGQANRRNPRGMKPTAKLHQAGQSLWLDNISREMLDSGQLQRYIDEYAVSGLTSNPSIFDKAIASGA